MELTILGCSGSYGSPAGGACSGYLVRSGDAVIWMDCGNGSFANLQSTRIRPTSPPSSSRTRTRITVSTSTGCTCSTSTDSSVAAYRCTRRRASRRRSKALSGSGPTPSTGSSWATATAPTIEQTQLQFSRTDHPLPTVAVDLEHDGKRLVYTADTGPGWSVDAFRSNADLVLSEATYQHDDIRSPIHLSARQAGEAAREAKARRLMLTHLWPTLDPVASVEEGSEAFGRAVTLASPHLVTRL